MQRGRGKSSVKIRDSNKNRAVMRLRSLIRLIIENADWLGGRENTKIGTNVWKNIAILVRKKTAAGEHSLLTLSQKAILRKPANKRSEMEKSTLNRLIGGLKCFRKYETTVKRGLAGCTYYTYCKTGRRVVLEKQVAKALYVVLSGELCLTQQVYDAFDNVFNEVEVSKLTAEDAFGEVSLLYDIQTQTSCRAGTNCELLYILKQDFDKILKASVEKSWKRIRHAMSCFAYFADCDEVAIRECCIYSKVREYHPDHFIYGSGKGGKNDVFFILSGSCKLVEVIKMEVCENPSKTYYTRRDDIGFDTRGNKDTYIDEVTVISNYRATPLTRVLPFGVSSHSVSTLKKYNSVPKKSQIRNKRIKNKNIGTEHPGHCERETNIQATFMEIGTLQRGYCFGLGEKMHNRSVISVTPTVCLLVPRYWINNHHPEVWGKIKHFLNTYIPSNELVFRKFQENRRWMGYKKELINDLIRNKKTTTSTSITDIPYTIRLNTDIEEFRTKGPHNRKYSDVI